MYASSIPTLFGRPEDVRSEHGALRTTIVELRDVSDALRDGQAGAGAAARQLLSDLSAELFGYFDAEERDDYFGTLAADCPPLKAEVERLEAAHAGMRRSVGSLQQLAADGRQDTRLAEGIDDVVDDFEEHEQAENELVDQFFTAEERWGGR